MQTDVILLPGLHGTTALFDGFIALAPPWARCRAIPLPSAGAQTFDDLARALEPTLAALEGFVLFAESFSAPIAARIASRLGQKVALLVLCNPLVEAPFLIPSGAVAWMVRSPLGSPWIVAQVMTGGNRHVAASVVHEIRQLPKNVLRSRLDAVASASSDDLARYLSAPLLAIVGTSDSLVSARACETLIETVPFAVLSRLPLPHLAAQVAPTLVWEAITSEFESAA